MNQPQTELIANLSIEKLYEARQVWQTHKEDAQNHITAIDQEIATRVKPQIDDLRLATGKDTGVANVELPEGFKAKSDMKKTIKWDSAKLLAASSNLPWTKVQAIFKIEMSVPEKVWGAFAAVDLPDDVRAQISEARTVTTKEVITLEKMEAA